MGVPSVVRLRAFVNGYFHALVASGHIAMFPPELARFRDWLTTRFSISLSQGWDNIILFVAGSDALGFDLFWVLWDEFIAAQKTVE